MEVKLLLSENMTCRFSADSGFHHPSATTWPCRTSMKLCMVVISLSAVSTNARIVSEETPCASGVLRGKPVAGFSAREAGMMANTASRERTVVFISYLGVGSGKMQPSCHTHFSSLWA